MILERFVEIISRILPPLPPPPTTSSSSSSSSSIPDERLDLRNIRLADGLHREWGNNNSDDNNDDKEAIKARNSHLGDESNSIETELRGNGTNKMAPLLFVAALPSSIFFLSLFPSLSLSLSLFFFLIFYYYRYGGYFIWLFVKWGEALHR